MQGKVKVLVGIFLGLWLLFALMVVPSSIVRETIEMEEAALFIEFGENVARQVVQVTESIFKSLFIQTGIVENMGAWLGFDAAAPADALQQRIHELFLGPMNFIRDSVRTFFLSSYLYIERIVRILFWSKAFLVIFIPLVYDAFCMRQVAKATYGKFGSLLVKYAAVLTRMTVVFPLVFFSLPVVMPGWIYPGTVFVFCLSGYVFVRFLHKNL